MSRARQAAEGHSRSPWIAGTYDCARWAEVSRRLDESEQFPGAEPGPDWDDAIAVIRERIESRFLKPAGALLPMAYAGFAVLALDSLAIESVARLRQGLRNVDRQSRNLVTEFLRDRPTFSKYFSAKGHDGGSKCVCGPCDFYRNVRSGIVHEGETQNGWLVRYGERELVTTTPDGVRVVDRNLFHRGVEAEFRIYLDDLRHRDNSELRSHLKRALDGICGIGAGTTPVEGD